MDFHPTHAPAYPPSGLPAPVTAPRVRFVTRRLYQTDSPLRLVQSLRTRGWQSRAELQRHEFARLTNGQATISIRVNGYVLPGGLGGAALAILDQFSRGVL